MADRNVTHTSGDAARSGSAIVLSPEDAKPLYFVPTDDFAEEVLVPGFAHATSASCMVGFFSSAVLSDLAPGLATYIQEASKSFRLIVSPFLSEQDRKAIEEGLRTPEEIAGEALDRLIVTVDDLQRHTLRCLSYLLATGRIELKIALMRDGLFHPKVWIFETGFGTFAAHGSSNMTGSGIRRNFEQISVSKSWVDPTQRYTVEKLLHQFDRLWDNLDDSCTVVVLPRAVKERILRDYSAEHMPTEEDLRELYRRATMRTEPKDPPPVPGPSSRRPVFAIPAWLRYNDGPYAHQGEAVRAWVQAQFRGVLEMATGSGKTLTSMIGAYRLYEQHKPLLIVVAAPYVPLIEQWCAEISLFGLKPINLTTAGNATARGRVLQQATRRLRLGLSDVEVLVVSHDMLCTAELSETIATFECARLLIADEAHNLGRSTFVASPPAFYDYRLALSATPVRQFDADGTEAIFAFFGPVVFRFTLKDAIGRCLVDYDYFIHPVELTETEMDTWRDLTARIRQNAWRQSNGEPDDYLARLYRDRRALLETAQGKIERLSRLLGTEDLRALRHTLIYASDKAPEQLDAVNALLNRHGVAFHQLTARETANREETSRIVRAFQRGEIQVLTAKRVLDEGVNIPEICRAYILASTTVERQWVQRRGRLLRTCNAIDKTHSVIHDLLALPPSLDETLDPDARALVRTELRRAQEFATLARNAGRADGPLPLIHRLVKAAFI